MSRLTEEFSSHPIHATLDEAESFVVSREEGNGNNDAEERRVFFKILTACREALSDVDPEMLSKNILSGLNSGWRNGNVWNELTNYKNNGNTGHLVNANNQINGAVLPQLAQVQVFLSKSRKEKPLRNLENIVDKYTSKVTTSIEELSKSYKNLHNLINVNQKEIESLSSLIDKKKAETDQMISGWQQQFTESQANRDERFSEAQDKRSSDYNTWRDEISKKSSDDVKGILVSLGSLSDKGFNSFKEKIDGFIDEAKEKHEKILELYEIVAGDSVASGYMKNASDEKKSAGAWRGWTIGFIVLTVAWSIFSYTNGGDVKEVSDGFEWIKMLKAISISGVLLFGAVYSAKQSSMHRNNEKKARGLALELKAIDPFISSLDDEQKKELKIKLTEKLFGQDNGSIEDGEKVIAESTLTTVIKGIVDVLKAK